MAFSDISRDIKKRFTDYDINLPPEERTAAQDPTGVECTDQTPEL